MACMAFDGVLKIKTMCGMLLQVPPRLEPGVWSFRVSSADHYTMRPVVKRIFKIVVSCVINKKLKIFVIDSCSHCQMTSRTNVIG